MGISRQLINQASTQQQIISASGRSALEQIIVTIPEASVSETIDYMKSNCQPLIEACSDNAMALGANNYNVFREIQTGKRLGNIGKLHSKNYGGVIAKSVMAAAETGDTSIINTNIGHYIDSAIKHSYEDAMLESAQYDPNDVRFARVPTGKETCDFCLMLASRGFVYKTKETAGNNSSYHAFCDCQIIPEFDEHGRALKIEGYNPERLYEQYKSGDFGFVSNGKGIKVPKGAVNYASTKMPKIEKPIQVNHTSEDLPSKVYSGKWDQQEDMHKFLTSVFGSDEYVGTCARFFEKDGRIVPTKGLFQRNARQIETVLNKTNNVSAAIGRYDKQYGAFVRINPLDGMGVMDSNVKAFKYALIEADIGSLESQYGWIKALNLPTKAIVTSGNKSVHALVKIDAKDITEYKERVARLHAECKASGFNVDATTKNPSRYMRMPGVKRGNARQALVSIDEGANSWEEWLEWADKNR